MIDYSFCLCVLIKQRYLINDIWPMADERNGKRTDNHV